MLGTAGSTAYDLRFRLLDIPVRVHPLFWLIMAFLSGRENDITGILIFIGCAFVSILAHEFGHGLMARRFGYRAQEIVLYGMGGYCICDYERQTPNERLAVLASGPGAGFLLMLVTMLAGTVLFGLALGDHLIIVRMLLNLGSGGAIPSMALRTLGQNALTIYVQMIQINLIWGLLNLLPIWPLDGGKISEVLLGYVNRRNASRRAHTISLLTAGILAVILFRFHQIPMGIWFAYFGFINYQILQSLPQSTAYRFQDDDGDWWKR